MNKEFLKAEKLNILFKYPKEYVDFIEQRHKLKNTSWWLIGENQGLFDLSYEVTNIEQGSTKILIPFAKSEHSEIMACFDIEGRVYLTSCERNDITDADWENRFFLKDFDAWLHWVLEEGNC